MKKEFSFNSAKTDGSEFYTEYSKSTTTLRIWFVTFGIGGLYLLLTNKELLAKLNSGNNLKYISILFLIGIGVQLVIALINKWVNWYNYFFNENKETLLAKTMDWLSEQFWIDILADIISCICFGILIWELINIFST